MSRPADLGIRDVLALFRSRDLSPLEVVEDCLDRIAELDPVLNATTSVFGDEACTAARNAEQRWGTGEARALEGVPFGLKDVIATAGAPTAGGCPVFTELRPYGDALVAKRTQEAGAILLAKLQTYPLALGSPHNPMGLTRNPTDHERISGGSSSGAGAAVGAGLLPFALGTDTGGSVRLPAAYCGVDGLRPTLGALPTTGVMLVSPSFDTVGPLARSCDDLGLVMSGIAAEAVAQDPVTPARQRLDGIRIGVPSNWFFDDLDRWVAAGMDRALATLGSLGSELVPVQMPHASLAEPVGRTIVTAEFAYLHRGMRDRWHDYDPGLQERLQAATGLSALDYLQAVDMRRLVQQDFTTAFRSVDVLVTPTSIGVAPRHDAMVFELAAGARPWEDLVTHNTYAVSVAGLPAVSVPAPRGRSDPPVGVQIIGPARKDALCLSVGQALEASSTLAGRLPSPRGVL